MPLCPVLQTLDGRRLEQPDQLAPVKALNKILPFGDPLFSYLGFIDPYGDTIFNGTQMQVFLEEWNSLIQQITYEQVVSEEELQFLAGVRETAVKCQSEPPVFLRFIAE
jgi:hypothetical protein